MAAVVAGGPTKSRQWCEWRSGGGVGRKQDPSALAVLEPVTVPPAASGVFFLERLFGASKMCSRLADWVKMSGAAIVTKSVFDQGSSSRTVFLTMATTFRYTTQGSPFTSEHAMQPLAVPGSE